MEKCLYCGRLTYLYSSIKGKIFYWCGICFVSKYYGVEPCSDIERIEVRIVLEILDRVKLQTERLKQSFNANRINENEFLSDVFEMFEEMKDRLKKRREFLNIKTDN